MIVIQSPRLQLSHFRMMDAQEIFGSITPAIARFMPWEPPSWSEYMTRCEKRVQAPEPNKFSFVIRRLDNRECLGMASLEDADSVSPELTFGSRKARTDSVLAGKSWPHLLSGDTQLSAKEVSSIRWPYKTPPAGVSLRIFTARSWATARIQNTTPSFTRFPSTNRHILCSPDGTSSFRLCDFA